MNQTPTISPLEQADADALETLYQAEHRATQARAAAQIRIGGSNEVARMGPGVWIRIAREEPVPALTS